MSELTPKQRAAIASAAERFRRSVAGLDVTISGDGFSTHIDPDGRVTTDRECNNCHGTGKVDIAGLEVACGSSSCVDGQHRPEYECDCHPLGDDPCVC